jgi:hypothetical protein
LTALLLAAPELPVVLLLPVFLLLFCLSSLRPLLELALAACDVEFAAVLADKAALRAEAAAFRWPADEAAFCTAACSACSSCTAGTLCSLS